jgi:hypothetical protein
MKLTYTLKAIPEASWYALGTAIAGIIGGMLLAYTTITPGALVPITAAIAGLPRIIVGMFLPDDKPA